MRPILAAILMCLAIAVALPCGATEDTRIDATQRLQQADAIKTSNNAAFKDALRQLDVVSPSLTRYQQAYLRYLHAWQLAYQGDAKDAIAGLDAVIDSTDDPTLQLRAGVSAVNLLNIESRNLEAYSRLSALLDLLPKTTDPIAREQALSVASQLYTAAGQTDLGLSFAQKVLQTSPAILTQCKGSYLRLEALQAAHATSLQASEFDDGVAACVKAREPLFAASIRAMKGRYQVARSHPEAAIATLIDNYDSVQATHYAPTIADVDATLAVAYEKTGDFKSATLYATRVVTGRRLSQAEKYSADALGVLYRGAKRRGDTAAALDWHEKYAAADKGYLNDVSARALAYQMVHQQVAAKKAEVAALDQQNQVLKLKQEVDNKTMLATRMGIALLLVVLGSVLLYALRTRRARHKFQQLAQRDGLTGIRNRQHFIECAQAELAYGRKSMREASAIAIDLDHFKRINDDHGHAAGDAALKAAVAACQRHLRSVDVFGRLGGEEFGILLPDCTPERAAEVAEAMRRQIAELHGAPGGTEFVLTASFGVSAARWASHDLERLLAQADGALYQAKRGGRNRVALHAGADDAAHAAAVPTQQGSSA